MAQIDPVQPVSLNDIWNPMQAAGPMMNMQYMGEMARHHVATERVQQAEEQRKVEQHQIDQRLKGYESILKNAPMLGARQTVDIYNQIATDMHIPTKFTVDDLAGPALALQSYMEAYNAADGDTQNPDVKDKFRTLIQVKPELGQYVQRLAGVQKMGSATGRPMSTESAMAAVDVPGAVTEVTKGFVEGPKMEAQIENLRAKTTLDKQQLENRKAEVGAITGREALYRAQKNEVEERAKLNQRMGELKGLQADQYRKKSQLQQDFEASIPQLQGEVQQSIGKLNTDIVTIEHSLLTTRSPAEQQRLKDDLAFKQLNLSARMAESRYLEHPTPEFFKTYSDSQKEVYDSLKRQSLMIEKQESSLGNLQFKQNEAGIKHALDLATNEGQSEFASLPVARQTPQEASRIARDLYAKHRQMPSTERIMQGIKNPNQPLVSVNTGQTASEEAAKDFMKSTKESYDKLKTAPQLLHNIEKAKELIPQAKGFMGPGGETLLEAAKFLNNRVGTQINTQGIKSAEELRSRIFFNIMENLKKMDAQPSQMQQMIMMDSLGKLGTDPNALSQMLDAYAETIRDKVQIHNAEVESAQGRNVQFPYEPRIKLPKEAAPKARTEHAPEAKGPLTPEEQQRLEFLRKKHGR